MSNHFTVDMNGQHMWTMDDDELEDDGIMEDSAEAMEKITKTLCARINHISDGLINLNKAADLCCQFHKTYKLQIHIGNSVSTRASLGFLN